MENATKALEIASSVLIALLIIGCLVFAYSKVSDIKKEEEKAELISQASDFNNRFSTYERDNIYGSEVLSIANNIFSYNKKEANAEKGYKKVNMEVELISESINAKYFKVGKYNQNEIIERNKTIIEKVKGKNKKYYGKNVSYWAKFGLSTRLEGMIKQEAGEDALDDGTKFNNLKKDIEDYNNLLDEQKSFARKIFKSVKFEYDQNTGRIVKMQFKEKN